MNDDKPIVIPIDGVLDLHTFNPKDVKSLISEYITLCRTRNIFEIRIIHGKGMGTMRRTVHTILRSLPEVLSFHLAGDTTGSWGTTIAVLKK